MAKQKSKFVDIDADWDGEGSLADHREKKLTSLKQAGFGKAALTEAPEVSPAPAPVKAEDPESD